MCPLQISYLSEAFPCSEVSANDAGPGLLVTNPFHLHPNLSLWFRRFVLARVHLAAIFVKWPERVPEQTRRVILLLKRNEALPILAEGGGHARGDLVPSEELRIAPLHIRNLPCTMENILTEGKDPPHATGFIVSRSHCFVDGGGKEDSDIVRKQRRGKDLTSSALETQRGSSTPISHWCRAAMVNAASRCVFGTHVPSKSAMAPPESSKSHAAKWLSNFRTVFLKQKRRRRKV